MCVLQPDMTRVRGPRGGLYMTHVRGPGRGLCLLRSVCFRKACAPQLQLLSDHVRCL